MTVVIADFISVLRTGSTTHTSEVRNIPFIALSDLLDDVSQADAYSVYAETSRHLRSLRIGLLSHDAASRGKGFISASFHAY